MDTCSAVMLSGHKPHVADAVIEAQKSMLWGQTEAIDHVTLVE